MKIQPSPQNEKGIELPDESSQPALAEDENPQPIVIRKLDRLETTHASNPNGA